MIPYVHGPYHPAIDSRTTIIYGFCIGAPMASKRREEESKKLLESEKAMSNMMEDDRSQRFCPRCAIATCLKTCSKCRGETIPFE